MNNLKIKYFVITKNHEGLAKYFIENQKDVKQSDIDIYISIFDNDYKNLFFLIKRFPQFQTTKIFDVFMKCYNKKDHQFFFDISLFGNFNTQENLKKFKDKLSYKKQIEMEQDLLLKSKDFNKKPDIKKVLNFKDNDFFLKAIKKYPQLRTKENFLKFVIENPKTKIEEIIIETIKLDTFFNSEFIMSVIDNLKEYRKVIEFIKEIDFIKENIEKYKQDIIEYKKKNISDINNAKYFEIIKRYKDIKILFEFK